MKQIVKNLRRTALISIGVLSSLVLLDMLLARSIYHPLVYYYQAVNSILCARVSLSSCQKAKVVSKPAGKNVVVSSHHEATRVGVEILKQGGNAIDAAVAVGYALAVVHPCCGNLGGGGFMIIRTSDGKETFINFREKAPIAAGVDLYENRDKKSSRKGYLAVGVPGSVKGLEYARKNYGTLSRQALIAPAIQLAEKGFILQSGDASLMKRYRSKFEDDNVKSIFLKDGKPYQQGERLRQAELSKTLKMIAQEGESSFYQGKIAQKIVKASQNNGGILSLDDFIQYQVEERPPLYCQYGDYKIVTTPPPGGGVPLCQMLNILETKNLQSIKEESQYWHLILSAMLFAYADRNTYLGDPNFVSVPIEKLISPSYAQDLSQSIPRYEAIKPEEVHQSLPSKEGNNTTHYSIIDSKGNAVSVTTTINSNFGAEVMASDTGFFLNNEMDDFTTQLNEPNQFGLVQGKANLIEPKKRPLSSMTPTIVLKDDHPMVITGSPGGPTITTTVLQVLLNYFDKREQNVVNRPKLHYQGIPPIVVSEPKALSNETFHQLWQRGYKVIALPTWGAAETIVYDSENNKYQGIQDSRQSQGLAIAF